MRGEPSLEDLIESAGRWQAADPDPLTRAETAGMLESRDRETLLDGFGQRLAFGTAGIRGVRGAGPGRMNRLLVRITTAGLGRVLLDRVDRAAERGVVVGFDARHQAEAMARDACSVLAGMGIRVHGLRTAQPTPLAAFAVLELGAAAGVVLTASHNPSAYNGYKVFWDNGAQIVPPIDGEISAAIDAVDIASPLPWLSLEAARQRGRLIEHGAGIEEAYLEATRPRIKSQGPAPRIVYTPLHGVAGPLALRAFARHGFDEVSIVGEQFEPDGDFPTLAHPNPEDPGALTLALTQAGRAGADLILANDPDGDRLAVAARHAGAWRPLTGDQIGCLLGEHLLASDGDALPKGAFVLTTIVSSRLLHRIARHHGARSEQTLSGLKWVWNRALELERAGGTFIFGYEEAIGFSVCPRVHDKDGITAAVLFADLARAAAGAGQTVLDRLDSIYRRHGVFSTRQISLYLPGREGVARIQATLERLRSDPPSRLGTQAIASVADLQARTRLDLTRGATTPIDLPASHLIQLELANGGRVSVRPSGTEPKLKIYLETFVPPGEDAELEASKRIAEVALDELEVAVKRQLGVS